MPATVNTISAAAQSVALQSARSGIDSEGRVWIPYVTTTGGSYTIRARRVLANGTMDTDIALTAGAAGGGNVDIAIDSTDRAWIVWEFWTGSKFQIQLRRINADGTTVSAVQTFESGAG